MILSNWKWKENLKFSCTTCFEENHLQCLFFNYEEAYNTAPVSRKRICNLV